MIFLPNRAMNRPDPLFARLPPTARLINARTGRTLDAADLLAACMDSAQALPAHLSRGDRIVVAEADPLDYLVALFAAWQRGLVAVAVNPALAGPEQAIVLETTHARAWCGQLRTELRQSAPTATAQFAGAAPALILMTSGTTGRPKGIVHSLEGLQRRVDLNLAAIGHAPLQNTLCVLPVFFGHGLIGNVLTPLFAGGTVHLFPSPAMSELPGIGPYIDQHRISFMSSVPSFWKLALRLSARPQHALERVHIGSAPLGLGLWRQVAEWAGTDAVFNMFGMTETANWIGGGALAATGAADGYVGQAWGGTLAVRDADGRIVTSGRGEVLVRTPSIMLGYFERPDLDAEAFEDGWFRTGDVGDLTDDSQLTLIGRIKTEINRGGIKIQAEEVDMLLEWHPDIVEACAFGIPDIAAGEAVAAAIVLRPGTVFDAEAIKTWCRTQARADVTPARLYVMDAIPRNDRGKIVRADVRRIAEAGHG